MRIRLQYIFIFMLLMIAIATSCSSDVDVLQQEPLVPDYDKPISIAIDKKETRAMHELNNEKLKSDCFGLYAYFTREYEYNKFSEANGYLYVGNNKFECQKSDSLGGKEIWYGTPSVYYPVEKTYNLTFVAYAPYVNIAPYDNNDSQLKSVNFKEDAIDITYAPSQSVEQQIDFCVSKPIFNQKSTPDYLPIVFDHMLTHVSFYAKVTGNTKGNEIKVDKLTLKHILGENVLRWTPADTTTAYKWVEATNPKYVEYAMSRNAVYDPLHDINIAKEENYVRLQNESGELYLLPQTLMEASVEIEYSLHSGISNTILMDFVTEIALPTEIAWQPGRKIRYNMDIHISGITQVSIVGIDDGPVEVVEWESVNPDKSDGNSFKIE